MKREKWRGKAHLSEAFIFSLLELLSWLLSSLPPYYPRDYIIIPNLYLKFAKAHASRLLRNNHCEMRLIKQIEGNSLSNPLVGVKNQFFREN